MLGLQFLPLDCSCLFNALTGNAVILVSARSVWVSKTLSIGCSLLFPFTLLNVHHATDRRFPCLADLKQHEDVMKHYWDVKMWPKHILIQYQWYSIFIPIYHCIYNNIIKFLHLRFLLKFLYV